MEKTVSAIELRGITKRFGEVVANDGIDLRLNRGEILSLLGENGSGKTTLMNMLSGIYSNPEPPAAGIAPAVPHKRSPDFRKDSGSAI